jgi:GNAT superfamily N-acetyltransferase
VTPSTDIVALDALATRPLRGRVLRPGQGFEALAFPGDDAPDSAHFGARTATGAILSVGSVMRETPPWRRAPLAWRVRGMATVPEARRQGLGARVLAALIAHAAAHGGGLLWCNARTPAVRFYERVGFVAHGEPWDDREIGPHVAMWRTV